MDDSRGQRFEETEKRWREEREELLENREGVQEVANPLRKSDKMVQEVNFKG